MTQEHFPSFFSQTPTVTIRDALTGFLGVTEHGILTYHYVDVVRLYDHSCLTVAGAYLMVIRGLEVLYGEELPQRGDIEAFMRGERDEGATGVTTSVVQLLTGAASETGLGDVGPAGRFARRHLLSFGAGEINGALTLHRCDTDKTVTVSLDAALQPFAPQIRDVMPKAVNGSTNADELKQFGEFWQERVRAFLIDHYLLYMSPSPRDREPA